MCGLRNEQIQKRLLAESEMMLTKALQIAQVAEAVNDRTKEMKLPAVAPSTEARVLGVYKLCLRCGKRHDART